MLPVSVPDIRAPTDSTPMEAPAVTSLPRDIPQDDKTPRLGRPLWTRASRYLSLGDLSLPPRRSYMPTLGNLIMLFMRLSTA
jgi:hypothetical protein